LITCPILLIPVPFLTYSLFKLLTGKKERIFEEKFGDEYIASIIMCKGFKDTSLAKSLSRRHE
jgi:hypothetical protein